MLKIHKESNAPLWVVLENTTCGHSLRKSG